MTDLVFATSCEIWKRSLVPAFVFAALFGAMAIWVGGLQDGTSFSVLMVLFTLVPIVTIAGIRSLLLGIWSARVRFVRADRFVCWREGYMGGQDHILSGPELCSIELVLPSAGYSGAPHLLIRMKNGSVKRLGKNLGRHNLTRLFRLLRAFLRLQATENHCLLVGPS